MKLFLAKKLFKKIFFPEDAANRFANMNYNPNKLTILRNTPYLALKSKQFKRSYIRDYSAARIANNQLNSTDAPIIELLICSTRKDFAYLENVVNNALKYSRNEISSVTIIVPAGDMMECRVVLSKISKSISVLNEDLLLPSELRGKLKALFPTRYGWVLQQLLILNYVLNSNSKGVLQIDSDTILTSYVTWIDKDLRQILYPTAHYHTPYYKTLNLLMPNLCNGKMAFVSHHMLFQPSICREIFQILKVKNVTDLFEKVIEITETDNDSPFCLEYELYAQFIFKFYNHKVVLSRFCNYSFSVSNGKNHLKEVAEILDSSPQKYKSISFHHYS